MRVRLASGLFRLWIVFSVLWIAAIGAYMIATYQNTPLPDLKKPVLFDDLVPAYEHCWDYRTSDGQKVDRSKFSDQLLAQTAECERTVDRWLIIRNGTLIALCIPMVALGLGWPLVWAFRGFLPVQKT